MKTVLFGLCLVAGVAMVSCGEAGLSQEAQMMKETCECNADMMAMAKRMNEAQANMDQEEMMKIQTEAMPLMEANEVCSKAIEEKYADLIKMMEEDEAKEEEMREIMKEHCPAMYELTEGMNQ